MLETLGNAIVAFFHLNTVLATLIGGLIGFTVGAIPGIGAILGITLVLPLTMYFNPSVALSLVVSIYMGTEFGGCVSSILVNVPGTSSAAATVLDGFPMSKQGRAITALSISAFASFVSGVVSPILCILMLPLLAKVVLAFGTPEFLFLALLGITCIAAVDKKSAAKGLFSGFFGLMLCSVGNSTTDIQQRYTFGSMYLYDGFSFLPAITGLFGVAEMMKLASAKESGIAETVELKGSRLEGIILTFKHWKTLIWSTLIGYVIGLIPAVGATTATFIAWAQAKRLSKNPDQFGAGCPEGVIATEASNNSVVPGALMPTFLFGIPGSASAAVILGAVMMHGLQPGRALFHGKGFELTILLLISLIFCSIFCLFIGMFVAPYFSKVTLIRKEILIPTILVLASLGVYIADINLFSVAMLIVFGILGFFMRKASVPVFPMVLGLVLGTMTEENFIRCLGLGGGSLMFILKRPICVVLIWVIAFLFFYPVLQVLWRKIVPSKKIK